MANQDQIKQDIETLKEIQRALEEENQKLADLAKEMADRLESETTDDLAAVDQATDELANLEKQADEEEKQSQISQAQDNVAQA